MLSVMFISGVSLAVDRLVLTGFSAEDESTKLVFEPNNSAVKVSAEISSTYEERRTGLSNRESLSDGEGMLFVYQNQGNRTFTMRNMSFGLDIVFVGSDCRITGIKSAEKPQTGKLENEDDYLYTGVGKYVVEVPYNYTKRAGIEESDRVRISSKDIGSNCQ